jgi:hypothetical protein
VQANQEFQRNVQILQGQRQRAIELRNQIGQAQSEDLKKSLQVELDQVLKKLEEDNQKMTKAYGFSLTRDYVLVVEKAHIYMTVTEKELSELEKEQASKNSKHD